MMRMVPVWRLGRALRPLVCSGCGGAVEDAGFDSMSEREQRDNR